MSALARVPRCGTSYSALQKIIINPQTINARSYAKKAKGDAQSPRQGYRGLKGDTGQKGPAKVAKREKNPGAFRPMPANQLSHEIFGAAREDELVLPAFHPETLTARMVGKAAEFSAKENDPFRIFGLPKNMLLEFRILSKPCSVVRDVTVKTVNMLQEATQSSSLDTRVVLTGAPGCGKSFLLLQAVEYCTSKDWIVIYIPRGVKLVDSTTNYAYDIRTRTYVQPVAAYQALQRLLTVNASALDTLQTQEERVLYQKPPVPVGTPLRALINIGLKEQALAPAVLQAFLAELGIQTAYPVLLAVDDFQALYGKTAYRDPHFVPIKSHHLSMPRLLMDYASGRKSFARGAVLGAINASDPNYTLPLELREALGLPHVRPSGPYAKRSSDMTKYTAGLKALAVPPQLSVGEAASLFEVWMKDRAFHSSVYDEMFLSKYSESSGNARDFVWKGLLSTLET